MCVSLGDDNSPRTPRAHVRRTGPFRDARHPHAGPRLRRTGALRPAVSDVELSIRRRRARAGAVHGRSGGQRLQPLRESEHRRIRAQALPARGRRGWHRHRLGYVRGVYGDCGARVVGRSRAGVARAVRIDAPDLHTHSAQMGRDVGLCRCRRSDLVGATGASLDETDLYRDPVEPRARVGRSPLARRLRGSARHSVGGGQLLRHPLSAAAARARRERGDPFGHQVHRRTGARARRRDCR